MQILKCFLKDYKEYKLFTTAHQQPLPSRLFNITHAVRAATEHYSFSSLINVLLLLAQAGLSPKQQCHSIE